MIVLRIVLAALGGLGIYASFPPHGLWWLAPLGVVSSVVSLSTWGRNTISLPRAAFLGFATGAGLFFPLLPWVGMYVGAAAWIALAVIESAYFAIFGVGVAIISRWAAKSSSPMVGLVAPIGIAGLWVATEAFRSSWPFGGFPWGRIAFGQVDGPLVSTASWGGAALLDFLVVAIGATSALALLRAVDSGRRLRTATIGSTIAVLVLVAGPTLATAMRPANSVVNAFELADRQAQSTTVPETRDTVRIAAVQGNVPRLGLDFNSQRAAVLHNHEEQTTRLARAVSRGEAFQPDVVFWPENASDIDPLRNAQAANLISQASSRIDAPIVLGTVISTGDGRGATNSTLVWDRESQVTDRHDKRFLQPFGEWLPMRTLAEKITPQAMRAGHFVPGNGNGVVTVSGHRIAVATCFEIAFDRAARDPVRSGAQLLFVPTNNATFSPSNMTHQQLAMSRLRSVEHNIPTVVAATSGVSAIVDTDGSIVVDTEQFEPATLLAEIDLDRTGTLATYLGSVPEIVLSLAAASIVGLALFFSRRDASVSDRTPSRSQYSRRERKHFK